MDQLKINNDCSNYLIQPTFASMDVFSPKSMDLHEKIQSSLVIRNKRYKMKNLNITLNQELYIKYLVYEIHREE